ncbi:hypothetical protein [Roseicyclus persicicus]|uniref:Sulfotransferase family protein n=1 Tax=Roseicyclus persicicus TaxID=2650661 RepID=A0A7X6GYQ8_9RHOB|nr:hypothetical protein [Roseibacterium persicicum]NKX44859.1 hypothetical protein [Roseibacterium persicicum]
MQVVFHLGAPSTDLGLLLSSLLKNRVALAREGVQVPPLGRFRAVLRDTARALRGRAATPEVQEALLEAIIDDAPVDRLVFSDPRFVCINRLVVQGAQIWPMIDRQASGLRRLFPEADVEFFIGMRNPATLIPALFTASKFKDFREFTDAMQPRAVAWSEMLRRLRAAQPDAPVVVWCNEDTPLLWGEIMREMVDLPFEVPLDGLDDLAETIMDRTGFTRMQRYLADNPPASEMQRRRIVGAFLDRYALDAEIEEELDLPGWTPELVEEMTRAYEDDMAEIARIPGVTLLTP